MQDLFRGKEISYLLPSMAEPRICCPCKFQTEGLQTALRLLWSLLHVSQLTYQQRSYLIWSLNQSSVLFMKSICASRSKIPCGWRLYTIIWVCTFFSLSALYISSLCESGTRVSAPPCTMSIGVCASLMCAMGEQSHTSSILSFHHRSQCTKEFS